MVEDSGLKTVYKLRFALYRPIAMDERLPPLEWGFIALMCLVLGLLTSLALLPGTIPSALLAVAKTDEMIEVGIEGAVSRPGRYRLAIGSTFEDLVGQAGLAENAAPANTRPGKKLQNGKTYRIKEAEWITITLEGAVLQPGPHAVKKGTKISDLARQPLFAANADLTKIISNKILKNGVVVHIPARNTALVSNSKKSP